MIHYVYITTNTITGKKYIGKHSHKKLENRYLGSGQGLKLAIQKYGKEFFVKEILEIFETEEEASLAEIRIIEEHGAIGNPDYYNRVKGGHGGPRGPTSRVLSEEHKQKISKSSMGKKISDDHKRILSELRRINPIGAAVKGSKRSEQTKQRMSESWKIHPRIQTDEIKDKISKSVSGERNAGFGKKWITNEIENDRIYPDQEPPEGWRWGKRPYGQKNKGK